MIWEMVEYFSPTEKWGNPDRMNGCLILTLNAVRGVYDYDPTAHRFVIHCGFDTQGHTEKSQHYVGNAVDFHVEDIGIDDPFHVQVVKMNRALKELQLLDHVGLGIYPQWNSPGFHLDVRGKKGRWGMLNGEYVSFSKAFEFAQQYNI